MCAPNSDTEELLRKGEEKRENLAVDQVKDYAKDKAAEAAKAVALELIKKRESTALGTTLKFVLTAADTFTFKTTISVVSGLLDPTMLSTDRDLYDSEARSVADDLSKVAVLYRELDAFREGQPSRAPAMIRADIERIKTSLRGDLERLNVAYLGVMNGHELKRGECPDVFEWQQQRLNQAIANVIALPN